MGLIPPPPGDDEDRGRSGAPGPRGGDPLTDPWTGPETIRVFIPDDLRGLEDEIRAVQAELGIEPPPPEPEPRGLRRLRRRLLGRPSRPSMRGRDVPAAERGWPPPGGLARSLLVGPMLAIVLLSVAALVALLPAAAPNPPRPVGPPRLATPAAADGSVGGLLPDVRLTASSSAGGAPVTVPARQLRPAVVLLVPDACACPDLVHQVMGQVEEFPGVAAALVGSGDPEVARLATLCEGGHGRLPAYADPSRTLERTYHGGPAGTAPTVLFVAANGLLTAPPQVFTAGTRIEANLLPLAPPARSGS